MCTTAVMAQSWIDVTDLYITNPRFDNNDYSGWQGDGFGAANPMENAEHYYRNYDSYQVIKRLPAGKYRLGLRGFYRMGNTSNDYSLYTSGSYADYQYAELYAKSSSKTFSTKLACLSSGRSAVNYGGSTIGVGEQKGWWEYEYYVPNNMEAAYYWFQNGMYYNSVEFTITADDDVQIGIRKDKTLAEDWTCIDDWQLEYYGTDVKVTSITMPSNYSVVIGETVTIPAKVLPENAINKKLKWTSSNENILKVSEDGVITGVSKGSATVTATAMDGSNKKATCVVTVNNAPATAENVVINELMASNVDVYMDPSLNYGSWVELYNPTSMPVTLGGLYVTDDPANLKQHNLVKNYGVIPAKGFAILNFDHQEPFTAASNRQINTKLNCDGGTFIISDGERIITQVDYPAAISRVAYARTTDGGETWGNTSNPTPGASNNNAGGFATLQIAEPVVDTDACLFSGSMKVTVTVPAGATLRYTTDGTTPTLTNGYTATGNTFRFSNTTCYRFRAFRDGYLPSKVVTRSYIADNGNYPFPIISVVTDRQNIFDGDKAIFSYSSNGRPGNGQSQKYNANMDWDRPVNFEYFTDKGEVVVSQECDFSSCGGWSRAFTPHSFKLKATKTYDLKNSFDYQFFANKPYLKHKTLQIRNGGNDNGCRIKDAAIQQVVATSGLNIDYQSWQPVHVFFNGEHYAVLNMREPNNKHFASANFGIDTDFMDQFEISPDSGYVQKEGTKEAFSKLMTLSRTAASESTYNEILKLLDVDEYANYMAVMMYVGNTDWPQNNVKGYRDQVDGKFRFVMFDTDHGFGTNTPLTTFESKKTYTFDRRYGYDYANGVNIDNTRLTKENEFVTLFLNMLNNATFRKKFVDAFCLVAGSVYTPERSEQVITEMANYLSQGGYVYPWNTANSVINSLKNRQGTLIAHLKSYSKLNLANTSGQRMTLSSNIDGARILFNDMEIPTGKFSGSVFEPLTLKASAPAGYKFLGWSSGKSLSQTEVFGTASSWKYYDGGSLDNTLWKSSGYGESNWKSGNSPLGYGKTVNTTTKSNLPTYYFRKSFTLDNVASDDEYVLNWTADDGFVVYVNGTEAGRYNMPSGTPNYNTVATSYAVNNPDEGSMTLNASLFRKGTNVIAVEVHNNSTTSSDILWECSLAKTGPSTDNLNIVSTETEYEVPFNGAMTLQAVWAEMTKDEMEAANQRTLPVVINEVSAANTMSINDYFKKDDWVELHNTTDEAIDVAGYYLSDNVAKPKKYVISSKGGALSTTIPAHGYLVVWCSKRTDIGGDVHASFKLDNADGALIMLTSPDEEWTDTLTYNIHQGVESFGRYPDGATSIYHFFMPTIGKSNQMTPSSDFAYTQVYIKPTGTDAIDNVDVTGVKRVEYYTLNGMRVAGSLDETPSNGVYIMKMTMNDGTVKTKKCIIR